MLGIATTMSLKDQPPESEWFAGEAFWQTFFPFLFSEQRFEIAEEQVDKILGLLEFKGRSILDLAHV